MCEHMFGACAELWLFDWLLNRLRCNRWLWRCRRWLWLRRDCRGLRRNLHDRNSDRHGS